MMLILDKVDQDIVRNVFEVDGDLGILTWQNASDSSLPEDFGTVVDEDLIERRNIGGGWNQEPISGKSVRPDTISIGEWVVWKYEGDDEATRHPGHATQLEAIEYAKIDQSKLLKTYEMDAEWDKVETFWLAESNLSATTFNSSFFGRSNKQ